MRLALALALPLASASFAQSTWYVDDDGTAPGSGTLADPYTSIEYALTQASTIDGDRIEVAAGIYTQELIDFLGKEVHVLGVDGPANTTVFAPSGTGSFPVARFQNSEGPGARLEGLKLAGGSGQADQILGAFTAFYGGGLFCKGASPTLVNLVIEDNGTTDFGGGAFFFQSAATLTDCVLTRNGAINQNVVGAGLCALDSDLVLQDTTLLDNSTDGVGGGLYLMGGSLLMENCLVEDNLAFFGQGAGCFGSGVDMTVRDSVFRQNNGGDNGAGIYCSQGQLSVDSCLFESNFANNGDPYSGGAIYIDQNAPFTATDSTFRGNLGQLGGAVVAGNAAVIEDCLFENNFATGAAIYTCYGGALSGDAGTVVRRSIFKNNNANDDFSAGGGAVYGTLRLESCTLVNNLTSGGLGGGARYAELVDCIVWNNETVEAPGVQNNLVEALASYSLVGGGWPGTGNLDEVPSFWDLADGDVHLLPGSPAIDSGDPTSPLDSDGTRADMGALPFDSSYCGSACDGALGTSYCSATPNSSGSPAVISALGNLDLAENLVLLFAQQLPAGQPGYFLTSEAQTFVPMLGGGQGNLCVGAPIVRLTDQLLFANAAGAASRVLDLTNLPGATVFLPGSTWNFQFWFRDLNPSPTSNTSQGLEITWQ